MHSQANSVSIGGKAKGLVIRGTKWLDFLRRLADFNFVMKFTFRAQGSHNQAEVSHELVDHLMEHQIKIPAHEDDEQDVRFTLCSYQYAKARSGGYEHRITHDDKTTVDNWSLRSLLERNPSVKYRGLPVVFLGMIRPL
jgi:hypothetical protein